MLCSLGRRTPALLVRRKVVSFAFGKHSSRFISTQAKGKMTENTEGEIFQKGILSDVTQTSTIATISLNLKYLNKSDTQADTALRRLIGGFPNLVNEINQAIKDDVASGYNKSGLIGIIGINSDLAKRFLPPLPEEPIYKDIQGKEAYSRFPSTGGQILIHLKSDQRDPCFNLMRKFVQGLKRIKTESGDSVFEKSEEVNCYLHLFNTKNGLERDLTGFEDGTKNPKTKEAKIAATIVPNRGGSYVVVQKWVHDLDSWEALSVEDQEKVFGRVKADSGKLKGKPDTSHVSRTDLGHKKEILRHSMVYGDSTEHGLEFIAYAADIARMDEMLNRMAEASSMNPHLDMMKYIKCVSGQYYYAPSVLELAELAK